MTTGTLTVTTVDGKTTELGEFSLEAPIEPGKIPDRVIGELRTACSIAADYALAFNDAVKAQAEKHKIAPKALRRFITALEADKVKDVEKEADDLQSLIAQRGGS